MTQYVCLCIYIKNIKIICHTSYNMCWGELAWVAQLSIMGATHRLGRSVYVYGPYPSFFVLCAAVVSPCWCEPLRCGPDAVVGRGC